MPSSTVVVFGPGILTMPVPGNSDLQAQLFGQGIFDATGEKVTELPGARVLESHTCVPFAGPIRLIHDITAQLGPITEAEISFAMAEPVYVGGDAIKAGAISRTVEQRFGHHVRPGYTRDHWSGDRDDAGKTLAELTQLEYFKECQLRLAEDSIESMLGRYVKNIEVDLPARFYYFYVDRANVEAFNERKASLRARINARVAEGHNVKDILQDFYSVRLEVSVTPMLAAIQQKYKADNVVLVVPEGKYTDSAAEYFKAARIISVKNLQGKMLGDEGASLVIQSKTIDFLVETLLAVTGPYEAFSAYMNILARGEFDSAVYDHAHHSLMTHAKMAAGYKDSHGLNHEGLNDRLRALAASVNNYKDGLLTVVAMQDCVEKIVYHFTESFRGKGPQGKTTPLVKIMPNELFQLFEVCQAIFERDLADDAPVNSMLPRLFLLWFSAELSMLVAGTTGSLYHFTLKLIQVMTSYIEQPELVDRCDECLGQLEFFIQQEIARLKGDGRKDVVELAAPFTSKTADAGLMITPGRKPPPGRSVHFDADADDAAADAPRPRGGSLGSASSAGTTAFMGMRLTDLEGFGLTKREAKHLRMQILSFPVGAAVNIQDYLSQRARIAGRPGANVQLEFIADPDNNSWMIMSIAHHVGRTTIYHRNKDNELVENGPVTATPIMNIVKTVVDGCDVYKCIFRVKEFYLGKEVPELHVVPDYAPDATITGAADHDLKTFAALYKALVILTGTPELKDIATSLLVKFDALGLVQKEKNFVDFIPEDADDQKRLIKSLQEAYRLIDPSSGMVLKDRIGPDGIKVESTAAGEKLMAWLSILLDAGLLTAMLVYIFSQSDYTPIDEGDEFFYLTKLNTALIRGGSIVVKFSVPLIGFKDILSGIIRMGVQSAMMRRVGQMPSDISAALMNAAVGGSQMPVHKLNGVLNRLVESEEVTAPEVGLFIKSLGKFSEHIMHSPNLPPRVMLALMRVSPALEKSIARGTPADEGSKKTIINAVLKRERMLLGVEFGATAAGLSAAITFFCLYNHFISYTVDEPDSGASAAESARQLALMGFENAAQLEQALSALTVAAINALIYAALYLIYSWVKDATTSVVQCVQHKEVPMLSSVSFWCWKPSPAERPAPLGGVIVGDMAEVDGERAPLLRAVRTGAF